MSKKRAQIMNVKQKFATSSDCFIIAKEKENK